MWAHRLEIAASVAIPLFAFFLNWKMREIRGYALSAAADLGLALMAFDLAAIVIHRAFEHVIPTPDFRENLVALFVVFFTVATITWLTLLLPLEHQMSRSYSYQRKRYTSTMPMGCFLSGWTVMGSLLAAVYVSMTDEDR